MNCQAISREMPNVKPFFSYALDHLKGRIDPRVNVSIFHRNSCEDKCLSAVDLFTWGIFRSHERNDRQWYECYQQKVLLNEQYP